MATGPGSGVVTALNVVVPSLRVWANDYLNTIAPSGSYAKGTGVAGTTDVDLFISLRSNTPFTLQQIYESLYKWADKKVWIPRRQNVSIGISWLGTKVDLVPGKMQSNRTTDHSLWRNKQKTWTQTNVTKHIALVRQSGRVNEIRALKIWRKCHNLDFPSFYLELTVMDALGGRKVGNLAANVWTVLEYLRDEFEDALVMDPANTNNWIDEDLTGAEKKRIASAAAESLKKKYWEEVLW